VDGERAHRLLEALDGLPLALELAAARLEVLTVDALEQRMADRFSVLSLPGAGGRRHGALYDAIAWSWELLPPLEQRALARLSVLAGPFDLDTAEAVLSPRSSALDALHGLLRRSLVRRTGARFSLLEAIREFAAHKLTDEERRAAWSSHAAWHASLVSVREVWPAASVVERLAERLADLGAVVERARVLQELRDAAVVCAYGRCVVFDDRGPAEGRARTALAAIELCPAPPPEGVRFCWWLLRLWRGYALRSAGQHEAALQEYEAVADQTEDLQVRALALANAGDVHGQQGREEEAAASFQAALELARAHGPARIVATSHAGLALWHVHHGRPAEVETHLAAALAAVPPGDGWTELEVRKQRGWAWLRLQRLDPARGELERALDLAGALFDERAERYLSGLLGVVHEARGQLEEAIRLFIRASSGGAPAHRACYLGFAGRVRLRQGEIEAGLRDLGQAVTESRLSPSMASLLRLVLALGHAARGDVEEACAHARLALNHPEEVRRLPELLARGRTAEAWLLLPLVKDPPTRDLARALLEKLEPADVGERW
jgi:tetratricopeptide (TPR) repeat protein